MVSMVSAFTISARYKAPALTPFNANISHQEICNTLRVQKLFDDPFLMMQFRFFHNF